MRSFAEMTSSEQIKLSGERMYKKAKTVKSQTNGHRQDTTITVDNDTQDDNTMTALRRATLNKRH